MPYWNEIPGGGGGRPLTEKEAKFWIPAFKIFFGVLLIYGAVVIGTLFLPLIILISPFILRDLYQQRRDLKKKGKTIRNSTPHDYAMTDEYLQAKRRRVARR